MNINNDLTIIIPTKDRKLHVNRWLTYANETKFPYKLLIADGAKDNSMFDFFSKKELFPNANYEYVKFPYDKSYNEVWIKYYESLKKIGTKYVAFGNDDDLFSTDGLEKSVEFLKNNPDFSSCGGIFGTFSINNFTPSNKYIYHTIDSSKESITNDSSLCRVKNYFNNYSLTFYDVISTELAIKAYKSVVEYKIQNMLLVELFTSFFIIASGKRHSIDRFYLFRESSPKDSWSQNFRNLSGDIIGQMFSESWSKDINNFFTIVAQKVSANDQVKFENSIKEIKEGYLKYVKNGLNKIERNKKTGIRFKLFKFIISIVKKIDNNFKIRIFILKIKMHFSGLSKPNKKEVDRIIKFIKKFHSKNINI